MVAGDPCLLNALEKARAGWRARGYEPAEVHVHPHVLADLIREAEGECSVSTLPWPEATILKLTVIGDPRVPPGFIVPLREGEDLDTVLASWLRALAGDVPAVDIVLAGWLRARFGQVPAVDGTDLLA